MEHNKKIWPKKFTIISFLLIAFIAYGNAQNALWVKFGINQNGSSASWATAITADQANNVIVTGVVDSIVFFGPYTLHAGGTTTAGHGGYLVKYDSQGNVLWALSNACNSSYITPQSVVTDNNGNIYLSGYFSGILTFGTFTLISNPSGSLYTTEFFLAKFDPNGNILWLKGAQKYIGDCYSPSLTIDKANNIYVLGVFQDSIQIGTIKLFCPYPTTGMFIAKYKPNGDVIWVNKTAVTQGGVAGGYSNYLPQYAIASDTSANIYAYGVFTNTLVSGSLTLNSGGGTGNYFMSVFLLKFDSTGSIKWARSPKKLSSATGVELTAGEGLAITTDPASNIYITANYGGALSFGQDTLPIVPPTNNQGKAFLVKYNPAGNVIWAEAMVSSIGTLGSGSNGSSLSADKWGHVYLGGYANSPDSIGGIKVGWGEFVIKFDTSGHAVCSTRTGSGFYSRHGVAAAPFLPDVNLTGTEGGSTTVFGNANPGALGGEWTFTAKWTCDTCKIAPQIFGNSSVCLGQSTTLTSTNGSNYLWSTGSHSSTIQITPSSNTTYTLYVANGNCFGDTSITITVNPLPNPIISGNINICSGNTSTLIASGGGIYSWNTGATTNYISVAPSSSTSYSVTAIDTNGCTNTTSATVTVTATPVATLNPNSTICSGNTIILNASGGTNYSWNTGGTTSSIQVHPNASANYSVVVSNGNCSDTAFTSIMVNPSPTANASSNIFTPITYGQSATLTASGGTNYTWSNGGNGDTLIVFPSASTKYCVTVTDLNNCSDTACVTVPFYDMCTSGIYLPNAFSPNNDGENDLLQVYYENPLCVSLLHIFIYERFGEKVFESIDPAFKWDGSYQGVGTQNRAVMNSQVLTYYLNATLIDGKEISKKGNISLVR